jgi:phosphate uptake regulator
MDRRKIQLVAGSTYSVSLPKEWVKKRGLREKSEIIINEMGDGSLLLSSRDSSKQLSEISINSDEYATNIDHVIFSLYYLGIEKIMLFSKSKFSKETKAKIRKTITYMSGTEITYEDEQKIIISVLLDKTKLNVFQLIYRISLIIESSLTNLSEGPSMNEITMNESEIDRLYHLLVKIASLSLKDANLLESSNIKNISLIPAYFLISKKLENMADRINHLSGYMSKSCAGFDNRTEIISFIKSELSRGIKYLMMKQSRIFEEMDQKEYEKIMSLAKKSKDKIVEDYVKDILRYLTDIEEEIVTISFYNRLISENLM